MPAGLGVSEPEESVDGLMAKLKAKVKIVDNEEADLQAKRDLETKIQEMQN
jgi:hypothetical protein